VRRIAVTAFAVAACSVALAAAATAAPGDKVRLCHGTASDSNPYVLISVSENALGGHLDGTGPGHGKNNHPDFVLQDGQSDCGDGTGGGEE
jgi:hypothetical protein